MTMPTVLVTGGAGFVGSHTCKALARAGFLPVVYDDLSNGVRDVVRWGPLEVGTLEDEARLASVVTQHEPVAVVHFAAFIEAGQSVREPERFYRNNVSGTLALLRIMRNTGIDKMVFSSTAAVYGEPQCVPISESHPLKPLNPYGRSKLMVEEILADTSAAQGLRYCALRYFNAAGADPEGELGEYHDPETHLIPLALRTAFGAIDHLKVFGTDYDTPDGTCIRDYVHVTDLADAHVRATQRLIAGGNNLIANLGIGRGFSVREVIEVVQKITGRRVNAAPSSRRTGDPAVLVADGSIARDELGWTPRYWILEDQVRHASIPMQRRLVRASTACIG